MKWGLVVGLCVLFLYSIASGGETLKVLPWETCSVSEGKDYDCRPGDRPRPFREYRQTVEWATEPDGPFSGTMRFHLNQSAGARLRAAWDEMGMLGPSRIRRVRYSLGTVGVGEVVLAEGSRGIFSPLMKWSGDVTPVTMPEPVIYRVQQTPVLVIEKDFGWNVPEVMTWAWVWGRTGPVRLSVDKAMAEAIQKVAPGRGSYLTAMDWDTLHCQTYTWRGEWPGKLGVHEIVDAWFELKGTDLVVSRVEFQRHDEYPKQEDTYKRWP